MKIPLPVNVHNVVAVLMFVKPKLLLNIHKVFLKLIFQKENVLSVISV